MTDEGKAFAKEYANAINRINYQHNKIKSLFSNIFNKKVDKTDTPTLNTTELIDSLHLSEQEKQK